MLGRNIKINVKVLACLVTFVHNEKQPVSWKIGTVS